MEVRKKHDQPFDNLFLYKQNGDEKCDIDDIIERIKPKRSKRRNPLELIAMTQNFRKYNYFKVIKEVYAVGIENHACETHDSPWWNGGVADWIENCGEEEVFDYCIDDIISFVKPLLDPPLSQTSLSDIFRADQKKKGDGYHQMVRIMTLWQYEYWHDSWSGEYDSSCEMVGILNPALLDKALYVKETSKEVVNG